MRRTSAPAQRTQRWYRSEASVKLKHSHPPQNFKHQGRHCIVLDFYQGSTVTNQQSPIFMRNHTPSVHCNAPSQKKLLHLKCIELCLLCIESCQTLTIHDGLTLPADQGGDQIITQAGTSNLRHPPHRRPAPRNIRVSPQPRHHPRRPQGKNVRIRRMPLFTRRRSILQPDIAILSLSMLMLILSQRSCSQPADAHL